MKPDKIISNIGPLGLVDKTNEIIGNMVASVNGVSPDENGNVTVATRNIGETVFSLLPLTDAGLHLLDGSLLYPGGVYDAFISHVAGLQTDYPNLFATEDDWQSSVTSYGVCGKFVYTEGESLRLPKVTGFVEGTLDATVLGDLVEAGLPNITGILEMPENPTVSGAFYTAGTWENYGYGDSSGASTQTYGGFDASLSNPIYGNSDTVQPQSIKGFLYMVVATSAKTEIQVNLDNVATDLNGKADVDLANLNTAGKTKVANLAMPSGNYVALTLPSSGGNVTAPADGYFRLNMGSTSGTKFLGISIPHGASSYVHTVSGISNSEVTIPAKKGDVATINYSADINGGFLFIYAEGSQP